MAGAQAAWYPDPTGRFEYRYWDGERWTEHVARGGAQSIDSLNRDPDAPFDPMLLEPERFLEAVVAAKEARR